MNEKLASLRLWIGANSAYPTVGLPLPDVVPMTPATPATLTREYYTDAPQLLPADGVDERVLALHAPEDGPDGTINVLDCRLEASLTDDEPPCEDPLYQERLLHELVHHVQHVTGSDGRFACPAFGEKEAYLLGGRFPKSCHATDPLPNRQFRAHVYRRCRGARR